MILHVAGDELVLRGIEGDHGEQLIIKWVDGGETVLGGANSRITLGARPLGSADVYLTRPGAAKPVKHGLTVS